MKQNKTNIFFLNSYTEKNLFRISYEVPLEFSYATFYVLLV